MANAYLNYGRWLVDCPGCGAAKELRVDDAHRVCRILSDDDDSSSGAYGDCGANFDVLWPPNLAELNERFSITQELIDYSSDDDPDWGEPYMAYRHPYDEQNHTRSWTPES